MEILHYSIIDVHYNGRLKVNEYSRVEYIVIFKQYYITTDNKQNMVFIVYKYKKDS